MPKTEQPQDNKIKVASVKIMLQGKEIELPIDQVIELRDILNLTFPPDKKVEYVPYSVPYVIPCCPPVIIERPCFPPPTPHWEQPYFGDRIICSAESPMAGAVSICLSGTHSKSLS